MPEEENFDYERGLTFEKVWAALMETRAQIKEYAASSEKSSRELKEQFEKYKAENDRSLKERREESDREFKRLGLNMAGISNSNGAFAEEYFYNALFKKKKFADMDFYEVIQGTTKRIILPDNKYVEGQFDVIMINGNAVALIEIKYRADTDDVKEMVEEKIPRFKELYPEYANRKIYLGIGSLSFNQRVVQEAKKLGVGLLKQVGEAIEYQTDWVRAY